jgi:L-histidine Nalpha-methyltransferase
MQVKTRSGDSSRFVIHQSTVPDDRDHFAEDVHAGLIASPKHLSPKYFYDALGSQLFEAICLLPEYYLTRSETEIFERNAQSIVAQLPGPLSIVELGSGSSVKTRLLIDAILARQAELHYQPIDISATILEQSARQLLWDYPKLYITAQVGDYTRGFGSIIRQKLEKILVLFLGSNIGNYTPNDARVLLRDLRSSLRVGDGILLGADLKKSAEVLEAAYDDSLGVTSAFNMNLLSRINHELGADFDLARFAHRSFYNERRGRIETYLVSCVSQRVNIEKLALEIEFQEGETIHTESSYKYDLTQLKALAEETGFRSTRIWLDTEERFSCSLWIAA